MTPEDFRKQGYALIDWIADYLEGVERFPVASAHPPGWVRSGASVPLAPGRSPTCAGWWSAGPSAAQTRLSSGRSGRKRATADDGPDEDGGSR